MNGAASQYEQAVFALDHNAIQSVKRLEEMGNLMLTDAFALAPELEAMLPKLKAGLTEGRFLAYDHAAIADDAARILATLKR